MADSRPAKRARQACEPCRRKKSKCPGERPDCAYCVRLGQTCYYAAPDPDDGPAAARSLMEDRMNSLEGKMDILIQQLRHVASLAALTSGLPNPTLPGLLILCSETGSGDHDGWNNLPEICRIYSQWYHRQQVILFDPEKLPLILMNGARELVLALQAVCLRHVSGSSIRRTEDRINALSSLSRRIVMERLARLEVELSTLQTLCLLSIVDFSAARYSQGVYHLSLAEYLTQALVNSSTYTGATLVRNEELKNCLRSIVMLQNFQGPILALPSPHFAASTSTAGFLPRTAAGMGTRSPVHAILDTMTTKKDSDDIVSLVLDLSDGWRLARSYAMARPGSDAPPPWSPQSDYSRVMQYHLELDSHAPAKFRWLANQFETYEPESLEQNRDYWAPWLCTQFVYAAIASLINHPFLLSMRLRYYRYATPHSFIQQSFEQITRHAGWVSHFLDLLEVKSFVVSDPTVAHCVVVFATIHLQHRYVADNDLRDRACREYDKCLNFLRGVGTTWPLAQTMVSNLEKLQSSFEGAAASMTASADVLSGGPPLQNAKVDTPLLWQLLIYQHDTTAASEAGFTRAGSNNSIFGDTLLRQSSPRTYGETVPRGSGQGGEEAGAGGDAGEEEDVAEFDLIGSAGIYGHRTAPTQTPFYPPNQRGMPLGKADYAASNSMHAWSSFQGVIMAGGDATGGIGAGAGGHHPHDLALLATEYGRSIETWFDLDMVP
ncbi:hypothetical protein Micbo1qcDRAFT_233086 [Microdochium bolleyi]|uniref:Zn(2)-C6 fungal-type domain-containing protein n=1 Tax=Microdochium bolleyi TaxID=196109 RepID=A0A136J334_9PEZI|nr:hypothetical protein Micbo1qcDRAFT_233086 [Microdochium bolleyi]